LTDENLGDGEPVLEGSIADVGNTSQGPGAPVINTLGKLEVLKNPELILLLFLRNFAV
jgi:hypothetical protein